MTALHYAASEGKAEAIAVLLDHRAYPNFMDLSADRLDDCIPCSNLILYLYDVGVPLWTMLICTIKLSAWIYW